MEKAKYKLNSTEWPGLAKLIEESNELSVVLAKILDMDGNPAYWGSLDLNEALIEELGDLTAIVDFFIQHNNLDTTRIVERRDYKFSLFQKWQEGKG